MDTLSRLSDLFMKFPGIGPRQARRFVYFLLRTDEPYRSELARSIGELRERIAQCDGCGRFFEKRVGLETATCMVCSDPSRDGNVLMIVEKDADLEVVEGSRSYRGRYFVLGGTVPLTESTLERSPRLATLRERLTGGKVEEIIFALSLTTEGEHTASLLRELIGPPAAQCGIKISTLGRGLSSGLEIEYADSATLASAIATRRTATQ